MDNFFTKPVLNLLLNDSVPFFTIEMIRDWCLVRGFSNCDLETFFKFIRGDEINDL